MGKIFMVCSLKGGVGKTTTVASLAFEFAKMGYKTLAVDMDFGVRSLDIALGHENSLSPSCLDVMLGKVSLAMASDSDSRCPNLFFMSAPISADPQSDDFELPEKCFDAFFLLYKNRYLVSMDIFQYKL